MDDFVPMTLSSLIQVTKIFDGTIININSDDLNTMHWNINRMTNKLYEVELCIASYPGTLHIIVISETWLTTDNFKTYQIKGYYAIHNFRKNSEGGGISVFVHESICGTNPRLLIDKVTDELHHFLVVEIPDENITVAVPYNRPKGKQSVFFEDLEKLCLERPNCLLMGDLNFDQLDLNNHDKMINLLESHGFALLNAIDKKAATRRVSGTILDLAATNMLHYIYKISVVHHGSSDHAIVYTSLNKKCKRPTHYTTKSKLNMSDAIKKVNELCNENSIKCGNELNIKLQEIVSDCTTTLTIKSDHRIKKRHVNRDLILAVRERQRIYNLIGFHPENSCLTALYVGQNLYVKKTNFKLRSDYEFNRIESAAGDSKKTWKLYKEIVFNQFQQKTDQAISIRGIPVTDSIDCCNKVNNYFCSAGEILATNIISVHGYSTDDIDNLYPEYADNNWSFKEVNSNDVVEAINDLPNKSSTSFDKVPISLLKATSTKLAPLLAFCINLAVRFCFFPNELLKGRLKLIHKSGDNDIENFRGLTILPSVSKIFEHILSMQLIEYLKSLKFFDGNQFGFIKNSSCLGAAFTVINFIRLNYRKKFVACMFVDLRRAFDTVDPERLAKKLRRIGLSENATKLMLGYLRNRCTATSIGTKTSDFRDISVGVAQGSKMGPLHFIIYMADLLLVKFIGLLILYADDAVLCYAADTLEELEMLMQRDADKLQEWLRLNLLTMNTEKTCYMTFGRARIHPDLNIIVDGVAIKRVRSYKYLGLVLDENLAFDLHIDQIKKTIRPFISLMWRNGRFIPVNKRRQIYYAYVQSHLNFMLPIYSQGSVTKMHELEVLQNRCIKALYGLPRNTASTYLYSSRLLPIVLMAKVERMTQIHKMMLELTKHNFKLVPNRVFHGRSLLHPNALHLFNDQPILIESIIDYNRLNEELQLLMNVSVFRSRLKAIVLKDSAYYYEFSPFLHI